ncbi:DUF5336 domain-containing protein [Mycobacterium sp. Aquia_216]|uniref:DUF5336 domain-containing protein n=1 Tax=Mycobacterium sp. Aquia_216 TaxID=2991729 RepID=UPI00227C7204|nr:DUF5336 domain-containing protein [Mycobacterium sp. Aquia_216]WAJ46380.1 DUF5336 domain-containing protein [Mycobacterium sp. Aquia_216]
MTGTSDHPDYPGYGTYGWNSPGDKASGEQPDQLDRALWIAVTVLGPLIFAVSLDSPVVLDFPVRFGVLAATVSAVSLLSGQPRRAWLVVVLAVTGFSDALLTSIRVGNPHWALTVVTVLNALQALVAAGAMLHEARVVRSAKLATTADYSAYIRLVEAYQAYQAYTTQYQQPPPEPETGPGQAAARGQAGASVDAAEVARESFAELQARYARHGVGAPAQHSRGSGGARVAGPVTDPGMPGANRGAPEDPYRSYRQNSGTGTVEPTGP